MSQKARLANPKGEHIATSKSVDGEVRLHVATSPRYTKTLAQPVLQRIDNGQTEMAVNGAVEGGGLNIWDGVGAGDAGTLDWTPVLGNVGAEDLLAVHAGTNGWNTGPAVDGDTLEFTTLTPQSFAAYTAVTFWLNVQAFPIGSQMRLEWRDTNGRVGNRVNIETYVPMTIGVWQQVTIPLLDFALTGPVDTMKIKFKNPGQHAWFDEFTVGGTGGTGPFTYRLSRLRQTTLGAHELSLALAAPNTGWAALDFASIVAGLPSGLLLRYWDHHSGEVFWSFNLRNNLELFGRTRNVNTVQFALAENMVLLDYDLSSSPARIEETKVLDIVVRDNLATLSSMNAFVTGGALDD